MTGALFLPSLQTGYALVNAYRYSQSSAREPDFSPKNPDISLRVPGHEGGCPALPRLIKEIWRGSARAVPAPCRTMNSTSGTTVTYEGLVIGRCCATRPDLGRRDRPRQRQRDRRRAVVSSLDGSPCGSCGGGGGADHTQSRRGSFSWSRSRM